MICWIPYMHCFSKLTPLISSWSFRKVECFYFHVSRQTKLIVKVNVLFYAAVFFCTTHLTQALSSCKATAEITRRFCLDLSLITAAFGPQPPRTYPVGVATCRLTPGMLAWPTVSSLCCWWVGGV